MAVGFYLIVFCLFVIFSKSKHQQDSAGGFGLCVCTAVYVGALLDLYHLWVPMAVAVVVTWG